VAYPLLGLGGGRWGRHEEIIMKSIALLATFTLACLAACAGASSDDSTTGAGNALSSSAPAKSTAGPSGAPETPAENATDAGGATPAAKGSSVTLDGTACTITSSGLDTGLDGNGWTLTVEGTCPTSFNLSISGVSDGAYPQTSLSPFLSEDAALLFLTTPDGNDAKMYVATESSVDRGPTSVAKATVRGTATVAEDGDATSTHSLTYEIDY
jgi:hypothetical protein